MQTLLYASTAEETLKARLSWRRTWRTSAKPIADANQRYLQVTDPLSGGRTVTRRLRIAAQRAITPRSVKPGLVDKINTLALGVSRCTPLRGLPAGSTSASSMTSERRCPTTARGSRPRRVLDLIVERTLKPTLFACFVQLLFSAGSS